MFCHFFIFSDVLGRLQPSKLPFRRSRSARRIVVLPTVSIEQASLQTSPRSAQGGTWLPGPCRRWACRSKPDFLQHPPENYSKCMLTVAGLKPATLSFRLINCRLLPLWMFYRFVGSYKLPMSGLLNCCSAGKRRTPRRKMQYVATQ